LHRIASSPGIDFAQLIILLAELRHLSSGFAVSVMDHSWLGAGQ